MYFSYVVGIIIIINSRAKVFFHVLQCGATQSKKKICITHLGALVEA
jgi:hypothetical protein